MCRPQEPGLRDYVYIPLGGWAARLLLVNHAARPPRRTRDDALQAMERTGIHLPSGDFRPGVFSAESFYAARRSCSTACATRHGWINGPPPEFGSLVLEAFSIRWRDPRRRLAGGRPPATPLLLHRPVGDRLGPPEHAGVPARRRTAGGRPSGLAADARLGRHAWALLRRGLYLQHHLGQSRQQFIYFIF